MKECGAVKEWPAVKELAAKEYRSMTGSGSMAS
jgi:hypothetical protein